MIKTNAELFNDPIKSGYEKCTGCGVCTLTCPVWHQTRDIMLTVCARARVLQNGGGPGEMRRSLAACLLCGACGPVCPAGVDTVAITTELRMRLAEKDGRRETESPSTAGPGAVRASPAKKLFFPGAALRGEEDIFRRAVSLLERGGFTLFDDKEISAISAGIEAGIRPDRERLARFISAMRGVRHIVAADGFLHRHLRRWLPGARVRGLGEAVLALPGARKALNSSDLYIIEPRGYHAEHGRLVNFYGRLRRETGCSMNTSLQRTAIPTGAALARTLREPGRVAAEEQARWILHKRRPGRVVTEDMDDFLLFRTFTGLKTAHIAELAE